MAKRKGQQAPFPFYTTAFEDHPPDGTMDHCIGVKVRRYFKAVKNTSQETLVAGQRWNDEGVVCRDLKGVVVPGDIFWLEY